MSESQICDLIRANQEITRLASEQSVKITELQKQVSGLQHSRDSHMHEAREWAKEVNQLRKQVEGFRCFKCGDGSTPLYCLNCAKDALQQQLDAAFKGIICIRCVKHFQVPPYNHNEAAGGECPTCEIERIMASEIQEQSRLINERDEARRAVTSLVCELATAIAERDAAQKAAAEMREFLTVIRQQVFPGLDLPAKYTVWMHDALSTTVGTSYFNLCPKCNYSEKGK